MKNGIKMSEITHSSATRGQPLEVLMCHHLIFSLKHAYVCACTLHFFVMELCNIYSKWFPTPSLKFFFFFLWLYLQHIEVPRLRVE